MGYALIWVETLAAALLLVALVTAGAARWPRSRGQRVVPVLTVLLLAAVAAAAAFVAGYLKFGTRVETIPFAYTLSWALAFAAGAAAVLHGGLRPAEKEAAPAARSWSRGRLALALAAVVVLSGITFSNLDLAIKVQLAAVRAEAGARTLALQPPRVPDRENAALVYEKAFEALAHREQLPPPWPDKVARLARLQEVPLDPKDPDLRAFLHGQERGLALLRQGAALPGCWFEHDYFQSFALLLPELQQLSHAADLLALNALARAADGDGRAALDDVAAILGIARHLNHPLLISLLVSAAVERKGIGALQEVLARTPVGPEDLARLPLEEGSAFRKRLQRACLVEETWGGLSVFPLLGGGAASETPVRWLAEDVGAVAARVFASPVYRVFFLPDDLAAYRRTMKEIQDLAARPYHEAWPGVQTFDAAMRANRRGLLTGLLTPAIDRCLAAAAEAQAARDLARLAVAATAYRAKHGKYPEKLTDLAPAFLAQVPLDPFDGQPLRLRRGGEGFRLYSVGPDRKDDGGAAWEAQKQEGDLVFRLR